MRKNVLRFLVPMVAIVVLSNTPMLPARASGTDVLVNDPALDVGGTEQRSSDIAVAGDTICAAWFDRGEGNGQNGLAGFGYSNDGGATWTDGGPFPIGPEDDSASGLPNLAHSVKVDAFYFASLSVAGFSLWRSITDCQSFEYVGPIHQRQEGERGFFGPSISVDNNAGSPYFGRIHASWGKRSMNAVSARVTFTTFTDDGGTTWSTPATVVETAELSDRFLSVAPNGDIYLALENSDKYNFLRPRRFREDHWVFKSTDGGVTWTKMTDIATRQWVSYDCVASFLCDIIGSSVPTLKGYIRIRTRPQIAIHPDATASVGYVIHAVYHYDSNVFSRDRSNVFYRRSTDGALTWSAEFQLNDDSTKTDQYTPTIAVSPQGIVVASWYDRRLGPNNVKFDHFAAFSLDGGLTWNDNVRISDVSSPLPAFSRKTGCDAQAWLHRVAIEGNTAHLLWADYRRTTSTGPDPDIYYDQLLIP